MFGHDRKIFERTDNGRPTGCLNLRRIYTRHLEAAGLRSHRRQDALTGRRVAVRL